MVASDERLTDNAHQMLDYRQMTCMHSDFMNERRCVKYEKYPENVILIRQL